MQFFWGENSLLLHFLAFGFFLPAFCFFLRDIHFAFVNFKAYLLETSSSQTINVAAKFSAIEFFF